MRITSCQPLAGPRSESTRDSLGTTPIAQRHSRCNSQVSCPLASQVRHSRDSHRLPVARAMVPYTVASHHDAVNMFTITLLERAFGASMSLPPGILAKVDGRLRVELRNQDEGLTARVPGAPTSLGTR